jgi:hypothetical protein
VAPIKPESAADRLTFQEQLVGRFVQMSLGALSIWQMSNQLSGKLVDVDAFEVVELLSLEIEDSRTKDDRYVDATAVEYFSVHGWPPLRWPHPRRPDKLRSPIANSEVIQTARKDAPAGLRSIERRDDQLCRTHG